VTALAFVLAGRCAWRAAGRFETGYQLTIQRRAEVPCEWKSARGWSYLRRQGAPLYRTELQITDYFDRNGLFLYDPFLASMKKCAAQRDTVAVFIRSWAGSCAACRAYEEFQALDSKKSEWLGGGAGDDFDDDDPAEAEDFVPEEELELLHLLRWCCYIIQRRSLCGASSPASHPQAKQGSPLHTTHTG
jgi:hypothetical protein